MSSHALSGLMKLWHKFRNKAYRDSFVASHVSSNIANQIETMREDRGWSQSDLAQRAGMKQSRISVLENPSNQSMNFATLIRIARAFDVGVVVRFVPFSSVARSAADGDAASRSVASFSDDSMHGIGSAFGTQWNVGTPARLIYDGVNEGSHSDRLSVSAKTDSSAIKVYSYAHH